MGTGSGVGRSRRRGAGGAGPCAHISSALVPGQESEGWARVGTPKHTPGLPPCAGTLASCSDPPVAFSVCQEPGVAGTQRLEDAGTWGLGDPGSRGHGDTRMRGLGNAVCVLPVLEVLAQTRGVGDGHPPGHRSMLLPRDGGPCCGFAARVPALSRRTSSGVVFGVGASLFLTVTYLDNNKKQLPLEISKYRLLGIRLEKWSLRTSFLGPAWC